MLRALGMDGSVASACRGHGSFAGSQPGGCCWCVLRFGCRRLGTAGAYRGRRQCPGAGSLAQIVEQRSASVRRSGVAGICYAVIFRALGVDGSVAGACRGATAMWLCMERWRCRFCTVGDGSISDIDSESGCVMALGYRATVILAINVRRPISSLPMCHVSGTVSVLYARGSR